MPMIRGVQQRARCHGKAGIRGKAGILESVSYRVEKVLAGSNPTLAVIQHDKYLNHD
jgi:hypothetical protein